MLFATRNDMLELIGRHTIDVTTIRLAQRPFFKEPADEQQRTLPRGV